MKRLFMMVTTLLFSAALLGQENRVTGNVINKMTKRPLPGVTISSKKASTITDSSGGFTINALPNEKLQLSHVGFDNLEVTISGATIADIELAENENSLDLVVVTGYTKERRKDLTGSVAVVDVDDMRKQATANPIKGLQGQVAGVYITSNGNPSGPATVRIRGVGTFNNNNPLIVVDGVPTRVNIQELNPADIESMQILKDAASATIYGARAANGVIVITTKKGRAGRMRFLLMQTPLFPYTHKPPLLDADGYGTAYWQAAVNTNRDPNVNTIGYQFDWNRDANGVPRLNKIITPEFLDPTKTLKTQIPIGLMKCQEQVSFKIIT